ncbi:hypothetical protein D3C72_730360 [compost metagenome]
MGAAAVPEVGGARRVVVAVFRAGTAPGAGAGFASVEAGSAPTTDSRLAGVFVTTGVCSAHPASKVPATTGHHQRLIVISPYLTLITLARYFHTRCGDDKTSPGETEGGFVRGSGGYAQDSRRALAR